MVEPLQTHLQIAEGALSSERYGDDYLSEYRRILLTYVRPVTHQYLEWGAGNTSLAIAEMRRELNVERLVSIDDNPDYLDAVRQQLSTWNGFEAHCMDLRGPKASDRDPQPNYATLPLTWDRVFDFIYIDGRRRLECALVAAIISRPHTIVALHDYRRARYQPVKALFDVIEDGSQFRVMRARDRLDRQACRLAGQC